MENGSLSQEPNSGDRQGPVCKYIKVGGMVNDSARVPVESTGSPADGVSTDGCSSRSDTIDNISGPTQELGDNSRNVVSFEGEIKEKVIQRIHQLFRHSTGHYLHDTIPCHSHEECLYVCDKLQKESRLSYKRGLLIIGIHRKSDIKSHVHVIHDCSYSNKSCRCAFLQKTENMFGLRRRRRSIRRRPLCSELEISDIRNIISYVSKEERDIYYAYIAGLLERIAPGIKNLPLRGSEGYSGHEKQVDACEEVDDPELQRGQCENVAGVKDNRKFRDSVSKRKRAPGQSDGETILDLLQSHICAPIRSILSCDIWLKHSTLKFEDETTPIVQKVFSNWERTLCSWTIHDFYSLYTKDNVKLYFSAGPNNVDAYYYSVEDSLDILLALLNDQYHNDEECIVKFVTSLFNVCERVIPKLNALIIKSPPSAGKSFFLECVKDFYLNYGKLQNCNKYNNFATQDAANRRIIFWNEPNYESWAVEKLKEFLGGDTTNTPVKYKTEGIVFRTPVLMATNRNLSILNDKAFDDRLVKHYWHPCPMLKRYNKKPNPLCIYYLFKHYNLIQ